jgi:hypothetical protein
MHSIDLHVLSCQVNSWPVETICPLAQQDTNHKLSSPSRPSDYLSGVLRSPAWLPVGALTSPPETRPPHRRAGALNHAPGQVRAAPVAKLPPIESYVVNRAALRRREIAMHARLANILIMSLALLSLGAMASAQP